MTGSLSIPDFDRTEDVCSAALAYAAAGWYLGPLKPGSKNPGSELGAGWPAKTTRDPHAIMAWFPGSNSGLFLHAGRSGAVVLDIDHPETMPRELAEAVAAAPFQSTRPDQPGRGHAVFAQPPHRLLGNSTGSLGHGWGEVRGRNGVIVAFPTRSTNAPVHPGRPATDRPSGRRR